MDNIFVPRIAYITNISNAQYAVVTFTEDHTFIDNEYISLRVSRPYGMVEINNERGKVLTHDNSTVTIDINSSGYTPFSIPADLTRTTPPCAVPSSSGVNHNVYVPTMILEDAFDNLPLN